MKILTARLVAAAALSVAAISGASAQEPVRIGFIDPLSGAFAATGSNGIKQYEHAIETLVNSEGGVLDGRKFEMVAFDNKTSPQESLIQLQVAIDQGIKYIVQGNSSGVAHALTDAVNKHNRRNPDSRVLYLNYSAVDPALTNENCNFWHFRTDANSDQKMDVLTDVIAANEDIQSVYVIGQDYSFGKAVSAAANSMLKEKAPEVKIVGDELHPIGKVKDFTPYARKIVDSGADAVITGNWGADMLGLGKAIIEAGFDGPIYTYYAAADGITAAFGAQGKDIVRLVSEGALNPLPSEEAGEIASDFEAKNPDGNVSQPRVWNTVKLLAAAIEKAGTADDVVAVAKAMEGLRIEGVWGGELYMRPEDHQLIQDVHVLVHTDENVVHDYDNSGYGLVVEDTVEMAGMDSPTTCEMDRPE